jgi:Uma2 family endonuclease
MTSLPSRFSFDKEPLRKLPTMYDLPSEFPEEPGLPDEFHYIQPQLLRRTLAIQGVPSNNHFIGSRLNIYYDLEHPLWHKRPDWFLAVNVPRMYQGERGEDFALATLCGKSVSRQL